MEVKNFLDEVQNSEKGTPSDIGVSLVDNEKNFQSVVLANTVYFCISFDILKVDLRTECEYDGNMAIFYMTQDIQSLFPKNLMNFSM